ncbi:MAG: hypothetical protein GY711_33300 [bacterium]|nr:hypothetical protein [bacterium]
MSEEPLRSGRLELDQSSDAAREAILARAAAAKIDVEGALAQLDALRTIERAAHHAWRIAHHMREVVSSAGREVSAPG